MVAPSIFALETESRIRFCDFATNGARKGPDLYNHGGEANILCNQVKGVYNRPKVSGTIAQDCFACGAGTYGDVYSATTDQCQEQCFIDSDAIDCAVCPYKLACKGRRTCAAPSYGEQCLFCGNNSHRAS
jgi:hypothetical protein